MFTGGLKLRYLSKPYALRNNATEPFFLYKFNIYLILFIADQIIEIIFEIQLIERNDLLKPNIFRIIYMKKILTFIIVVLICQGVFAQDKFSLGFEVGGNLSNFNNEVSFREGDALYAVSAGLSLIYGFDEHAFLKTGLSYRKKGETFEVPGIFNPSDGTSGPSEKVDSSISTITLPLYGGYRTNGSTRFFVNGGPFLSYVLDADNIIEKDLDFGFGVGIGLEYDFTDKQGLRLEVLNEFGFANVNGSSIDEAKITTNSLGLYLSYQIVL